MNCLSESGERSPPLHACARDHSSGTNFKGSRKAARSVVDSGSVRQPVVRSGDAIHRLAARSRRTPFPASESLAVPVSPFPTKDVFLIGDNNRNRNGGFVVKSFHGGRSHDRDTRDEWIQSLA